MSGLRMKTNREVHEEAAGYNLSAEFFRMLGIDPDAEYKEKRECFGCGEEFVPDTDNQTNCPKCAEIYFDCGCERPYCLCYTR